MEMSEIQKEQFTATNKLLAGLKSGKIFPGMEVKARAKFLKITPTQYYVIVKRLKVLGKLSKKSYRRGDPMVILSDKPLTTEEFLSLGDPYRKNKQQSYQKKKKAATKTKPSKPSGRVDLKTLLPEPIEIPINDKPDNITLSGPVDAMIRFLQGMKGTV